MTIASRSGVYDPLIERTPGEGQPLVQSYWTETAGTAPEDDGPVTGDMNVEVAIIGAGYTGMSCAYFLAQQHGIRAVVLEANQVAWGCSSRNGSFARISGGRVPFAELVGRYGEATARSYFDEMAEGLRTVKGLILEGRIDCDAMPDEVYKVASRPEHVDKLRREVKLYNDIAGYPARLLSQDELAGIHGGQESFGALFMPDGFAMHPLKLAWGIQKMARSSGATIYTGSPVIEWNAHSEGHTLKTPRGNVRAKFVVLATNGYTNPELNEAVGTRVHPVYSQIIVTAPMTRKQQLETLPGTGCMFDTHNLLHYYRRLPDGRIMFGGRSAISGRDVGNPRHERALIEGMVRKFPELRGIGITHTWGGWVAVSRDSLPFAFRIPELKNAFFGGGYAGSGVSFSMLVGKRLAAMIAGDDRPSPVEFLHRVPGTFPHRIFTRMGQRMTYALYRFKDSRASMGA
ncbi:Oxidoreductase [Paraburkholderia unamae]|uniref:NAD(P)/FAD-dependent oxidoreductase n=1 Tax=Paraburkholderia unamae TaxID=219649 RepID=UPI001CB4A1AE|nr:FAD-binding oxidoreductase [Paraburkholderia unamae]CAG9267690.1 Oxidoreductase [Paraburkholderia unamae]